MPLKDQITGGHYTFISGAWQNVSQTGMEMNDCDNVLVFRISPAQSTFKCQDLKSQFGHKSVPQS